jgi:hypothetical protein
MRRAALAALALLAVAAPAASAKTTKNFTFQSSGTAVQPGAVAGIGAPGTYQDFPVTVKPDESNGAFTIGLLWDNPADDWDLYVYAKIGNQLEQVGSSAGGPPSTEEQTTVQSQGVPLDPGQYVIRVQNYAAASPDFRGTGKFTAYTPPNIGPKASLKAPKKARAGKRVKIDASKSKDPDGKIVSYAFDFDGDGTMETAAGTKAKIRHRFKPGRHRIAVRVVDNKGARAYANRTIVVLPKKKRHKH